MGRMQAEEMRDHLPQDAALSWHLTCNHCPPLPVALVPVCQKAIELANQGLWDEFVLLPRGPENFLPGVKVAQIVEGCHLDSFID